MFDLILKNVFYISKFNYKKSKKMCLLCKNK